MYVYVCYLESEAQNIWNKMDFKKRSHHMSWLNLGRKLKKKIWGMKKLIKVLKGE